MAASTNITASVAATSSAAGIQKYYLRMRPGPAKELRRSYPSQKEFVDSLIAARLNGYAVGHVSLADIQREIKELSLAAGEDKSALDFLNR